MGALVAYYANRNVLLHEPSAVWFQKLLVVKFTAYFHLLYQVVGIYMTKVWGKKSAQFLNIIAQQLILALKMRRKGLNELF